MQVKGFEAGKQGMVNSADVDVLERLVILDAAPTDRYSNNRPVLKHDVLVLTSPQQLCGFIEPTPRCGMSPDEQAGWVTMGEHLQLIELPVSVLPYADPVNFLATSDDLALSRVAEDIIWPDVLTVAHGWDLLRSYTAVASELQAIHRRAEALQRWHGRVEIKMMPHVPLALDRRLKRLEAKNQLAAFVELVSTQVRRGRHCQFAATLEGCYRATPHFLFCRMLRRAA